MKTLPVIVKKELTLIHRFDGSILYKPTITFRDKFSIFGLVFYYNASHGVILLGDYTHYYYHLREPNGVVDNFHPFEDEDAAIRALNEAVRRFLIDRQKEINRTVVKVSSKQLV